MALALKWIYSDSDSCFFSLDKQNPFVCTELCDFFEKLAHYLDRVIPSQSVMVAGSYVLHRLLKTTSWVPGDIDVFCGPRTPLLAFILRAYAQACVVEKHELEMRMTACMLRVAAKSVTSGPGGSIEVLMHSGQKISFLFRDVVPLLPAFDISVCAVAVPLSALYESKPAPLYVSNMTVLDDIDAMRMQVPATLFADETPACFGTDARAAESFAKAKASTGARVKKYEGRGFSLVVDSSEARAKMVNPYTNGFGAPEWNLSTTAKEINKEETLDARSTAAWVLNCLVPLAKDFYAADTHLSPQKRLLKRVRLLEVELAVLKKTKN